MTDYTWTKGRSGSSAAGGSDSLVTVQLAMYPPSSPLTVRRMIVDWGIDLKAVDPQTGSPNYAAPLSIGLINTTSSTSTPLAPGAGPKDDPAAYNVWFEGGWYANGYGISTSGPTEGFFTASGRINRDNPYAMTANELYTTWWLVLEVEDASHYWTTFYGIAWYQILTAPTVG